MLVKSRRILKPSSPEPARSTRPAQKTRTVLEGHVTAVLPDGRAKLRTPDGRSVDCRLARGVEIGWLRAALAFGPVEAEGSLGDRGGSVWAVFPGPEHAKAISERVSLTASKGIDLTCGESTVTLNNDGRVRVRGRDVAARGTWIARLQGRTVRIN